MTLGGFHTCALMTGGGVKCWGSNGFGGLGNGDTNRNNKNTPVEVNLPGPCLSVQGISPRHVSSLRALRLRAVARLCVMMILSAASFKAQWNSVSLSAHKGNTSATGPYMHQSSEDLGYTVCNTMHACARTESHTRPAGGWHTCALMSGGGIKCWGFIEHGQLGYGETSGIKFIQTDVSLGSGVRTSAVNKMRRESLL